MWKIAAVCTALLVFSAPALAQTGDTNESGGPSLTPGGTLILGTAALGLAAWGLSAAIKKKATSP